MMEKHEALDKAIFELRKVLHLQMEIAYAASLSILPDMDKMEQCNRLIELLWQQIRLIMIPGNVQNYLDRRDRARVIEAKIFIQQFGLDKLQSYIDYNEPTPFEDFISGMDLDNPS